LKSALRYVRPSGLQPKDLNLFKSCVSIKCVFDLRCLLQFCMDYETSDKSRYPTFARTRPPDTQISKSVVSVLLNFNWTQASGYSAPRI